MAGSCVGCKFLYLRDSGYSNYTVDETFAKCALNLNPQLPDVAPYDWRYNLPRGKPLIYQVFLITTGEYMDLWVCTRDGQCERFAFGPMIELDVDRETSPEEQTEDKEVITAINNFEGWR